MSEHKVSIIMVQVAHKGWKQTRYVTRSGKFNARMTDAVRYSSRDEASQVVSSLTNIWGNDGFTFKVFP